VHKQVNHQYLIPTLSKALDILELIQRASEPLTPEMVHRQTKVSRATVYRVLKTFLHRGYVTQAADGTYRMTMRPNNITIGYTVEGSDQSFSAEVVRSLRTALDPVGFELVELKFQDESPTALERTEAYIKQHINLILECGVSPALALVIGRLAASLHVPLISVDQPHPNAIYLGVDNYRVGNEAGHALADHALINWSGAVDHVVGLDSQGAGLSVQSRITGAFDAIREKLPDVSESQFVKLNCHGKRDGALHSMLAFLNTFPEARHILVATTTDTSAMGAIEATKRLRRQRHVVIVGQNCTQDALKELKDASSPLIASVSHELGRYGPRLVRLGMGLLKGQGVAGYNYMPHSIVWKGAAALSGAGSDGLVNGAPSVRRPWGEKAEPSSLLQHNQIM
jgi:ribose transport system substrate-binding protein